MSVSEFFTDFRSHGHLRLKMGVVRLLNSPEGLWLGRVQAGSLLLEPGDLGSRPPGGSY